MKKLLKSMTVAAFLLLAFTSIKAQSYDQGVADGVTMVNQLKETLLQSQYSYWGILVGVNRREVINGTIGSEDLDPYGNYAGRITVFVNRYSWSQASFNLMAWGDVSVQNIRNWLELNRDTNDYFRGYYHSFHQYWFFDDSIF